MSTHTLLSRDGTTETAITVLPGSSLYETQQTVGFDRRAGYTYAFGGRELVAAPVRLRVKIAESSEGAASQSIFDLTERARDATSLRDDRVTAYRSLQLDPTGARNNRLWENAYIERVTYLQGLSTHAVVDLLLLPRFARWTTTQADTISAYNAASKV